MRHLTIAAALLLVLVLSGDSAVSAESTPPAGPRRLKRSESFLGIHFDFHAGPDCTEIGKHTTRAMIESIIDQVHPDYLQIDCKGHRGLSSYPTKVGHPAPGFVGDPLRLWRQVTAERGVALYMHYSGVWDSEAILRNPGWGAVNADGKLNGKATSFFGPYAEQLLLPQLRELAGDYGVDGVWVDGECWASVPDYSEAALQAFRAATGIQAVPHKPGDSQWFEFLEFHREAFRRYLRHYVGEMKRTHPDFQVCSNWAFTDHMPEAVSAPIDFLSGDYSPDNSVNSARLSGRYLVRQGKPWDLMAWSFTRAASKGGTRQKTAVQLQREAAVVIALGGGFQAYFKQKRDGSIYDEQMAVMAEVAKFCRARQAICHRALPVPQVALLLSTAAHYRLNNGLFSRELSRLSGTLQALLESQLSVEVVGEHHLAGRLQEYPLIVVPEWEVLEPKFKKDLAAYVRAGGNLLLVGPKAAAMFQKELDVTLPGDSQPEAACTVAYRDQRVILKTRAQAAELGPSAKPLGEVNTGRDIEPDADLPPAASVAGLGKGKIAAIYFTLGRQYQAGPQPAVRSFLNAVVRELFPKPIVDVKGSANVDVVVNRTGNKLLVNLVNTAGPHADKQTPVFDTIPPVEQLSVTIRQATAPTKLTLEPGARPLAFDYQDGEIRLAIPRLEIHDIIVVE